MGQNLGLTRGVIFADAAAARVAGYVGQGAGHVVERAAGEVCGVAATLREALERDLARPTVEGSGLEAAFDLEHSVATAALWTHP